MEYVLGFHTRQRFLSEYHVVGPLHDLEIMLYCIVMYVMSIMHKDLLIILNIRKHYLNKVKAKLQLSQFLVFQKT